MSPLAIRVPLIDPDRFLDPFFGLLCRLKGDHRADVYYFIERVAHFQFLRPGDEISHKPVVNLFMEEDSLYGNANLSRVSKRACDKTLA